MEKEKIEIIKLLVNNGSVKDLSLEAQRLLLVYANAIVQQTSVKAPKVAENKEPKCDKVPRSNVPLETIVLHLLKGNTLELDDLTINRLIDFVEENYSDYTIRIVDNRVSLVAKPIPGSDLDCDKKVCYGDKKSKIFPWGVLFEL